MMAARAIWKGNLKLASTKLPVKLYSAVKDQTVRFHVLDVKSKTRVKQHMINPETGDEVSKEEIQKGFEVEPGTLDRKSTRLNSSHLVNSYAVFCLKKKNHIN